VTESGAWQAEGVSPGGGGSPPGARLAGFVSFFAYIGIAALIVAIALTCADIVWRRVVGGAFMDIYDVTKLCLVIAASWSIPYGFIHGSHVSVDLLVTHFPDRLQRAMDVVTLIAAAALLGFLLWLSWDAAQLRYLYGDTSPNLRIPMTYYWAILLFGLALAIVAACTGDLEVWRLVTSGFLHANLMHIAFNGILLWRLGQMLEPSAWPAAAWASSSSPGSPHRHRCRRSRSCPTSSRRPRTGSRSGPPVPCSPSWGRRWRACGTAASTRGAPT
jgi:TRAP-type C4-dicarboxylate transport system permease small subunit